MSTYVSKTEAVFDESIDNLKQNNECYDKVVSQIFSNPDYYTIDSCNNLLLTPQGNTLFQQLIEKNEECSELIKESPIDQQRLINEYQQMVRRRREIDQDMNHILNMNARSNYRPTLYQQTNQTVSVGIMFTVLAISMMYYTIVYIYCSGH